MSKDKKIKSTFEKEMQDPAFRKAFKESYKELLLDEIIVAMMEEDEQSVRKLAKEAGLSPAVIQALRSGKQTDIKLKNFIKVAGACGYHLVLEKDDTRVPIS